MRETAWLEPAAALGKGALRELFRDDYYAVTVDPDGIARITRLAKGYTTLIEAEASLDRLQLCIRRLPRSMAPKALVDLRESPGWNDEAFEKKMRDVVASTSGITGADA